MKLLTKDRQNAAKQFIFSHARPLEKALYQHYFEEGSREVVLRELASCSSWSEFSKKTRMGLTLLKHAAGRK